MRVEHWLCSATYDGRTPVSPAPERRPPVIHEGLPTQLPDIDPDETQEWVESLDALLDERGRDRARYVMLRLLERARERQVGVPGLRGTDYLHTSPRARVAARAAPRPGSLLDAAPAGARPRTPGRRAGPARHRLHQHHLAGAGAV